MNRRPKWLRAALGAAFVLTVALSRAIADEPAPELPPPEPAPNAASPEAPAALASAGAEPSLAPFIGRNIARIEIVFDPPEWAARISLNSVRVGQTFTPEVARRALDELGDSGGFGDLKAEVEPLGDGVLLRIRGVARRVIANVRLSGVSDAAELLRIAKIRVGSELTAGELPELTLRLERELARRGYPEAKVRVDTLDTDDPIAVVLSFECELGEPARVAELRFLAWPDHRAPGLSALLARYGLSKGDRADSDAVEAADRGLEDAFKRAGYHEARVESEVKRSGRHVVLAVKVYAGSRYEVRIEGARRFDVDALDEALELDEASDRSPTALAQRLRDFYVARGFLDVQVEYQLTGRENASARALVLRVHEGDPVRVAAREYPCLDAEHSPADVGSEIDSFLSELPGGTLIDTVDPNGVDALFGPRGTTGRRAQPYSLNPWSVYSPDVYERAVEHLKDLFRSQGYLSASVGPVIVARRRCDPRSPPGACMPVGPRVRPPLACTYDPIGLPMDEPSVDPRLTCREDIARGVHCEQDVVVSLPIKLGPQTFVQSVRIDGNLTLADEKLVAAAELAANTPVSQLEVDRARRRLLDRYAEEGFAFADIETNLELSADHRKADVVFVVSERKQVKVSRVVVRGARVTSESLIRRRVALGPGDIYRRSLVRRTEEHLATLGVFSTVTVGLEDPYVPASEKVMIVTVQERVPQSLDLLAGFSTGEGFRAGFEYRHANLGGQAVRFTLHIQAGLLPLPLIFEDDVREKYESLDILERLERRNTATFEFPDIGLGPLFRLSVEGVDVLDNARDYGLTKDAGIVTLMFVPERRLSFQLAVSFERNNATIFGDDQKQSLEDYILAHPDYAHVFRVPEGTTLVVAERVGASWDRRDNPLQATRGTFVSADLEYVKARPVGDTPPADPASANVFQPVDSDFLHIAGRIAGYVRLSRKGLALAASLRSGVNKQLTSVSQTYPDRLFFLGGMDTLRGFSQDSLVPEDVAQRLLDPASELSIEQVVIRGGDLFINPRLELRIPFTESIETALFVDSGNLWSDPSVGFTQLPRLRYAMGSGLRVGTPIGPLVFDYGFNIARVLDAIDSSRTKQRYWEDLGAFHFSIGLF